VLQWKNNKSPRIDGIGHEFYKEMWGKIKDDMVDIFNGMYLDDRIHDTQKHVVIVCITKSANANNFDEHRPLTLLNDDLKIFTRILANRLKPWIANIPSLDQYCGTRDSTIYEAQAMIRDVRAYTETTMTPDA
jgi:hypothetical protein